MASFPSNLPGPLLSDYSNLTSMALSSVRFERGNRRQRKNATKPKQSFTLSFDLTTAQLWQWQSWANQFGYDWHTMPLVSFYSGFSAGESALLIHTVRYTSAITIDEILDFGRVKVSVQAEMDVTTVPQGVLTPSGDWYIAGTPSALATNTVTAGAPNSLASNAIIAGSPANPAA